MRRGYACPGLHQVSRLGAGHLSIANLRVFQMNHANPLPSGQAVHALRFDRAFDGEGQAQRSRLGRFVCIAAPVLTLVGGVAAYALSAGVNSNNFDERQTYDWNQDRGLLTAAGAVGGALLSLGIHCLGRALCHRSARVVGEDAEAAVSPGQRGQQGPAGFQRVAVAGGVELPARVEFMNRGVEGQPRFAGSPSADPQSRGEGVPYPGAQIGGEEGEEGEAGRLEGAAVNIHVHR